MITLDNILNEYPKIDQAILPEVLNNNEFSFIQENIDLYNDDDTIKEYIDLFIDKLNKYRSSNDQSSIKSKSKKQSKKVKQKKVRTINKSKAKPKVKAKVSKPKKAKTVKHKRDILTDLPNWLVALRKAARMANKEYSQTTLRNFLTYIQKSFSASRPGATKTPHIDYIIMVQNSLVNSINKHSFDKKLTFKIPDSTISSIKGILKDYMVKIDKESPVKADKLMGIPKKNKCCNSGLGSLGVVNSKDLAEMNFKTLDFTGKFKELIGNPTLPFHIMIYGLPGSGKSTLAINFAKYLAENQKLKVLFLAREEGISGTTQEKFIRLNAIHHNIDIAEKMPENLNNYDVLVIDSVNEMNMSPDNIRQIISKYPKLSTVQIFKATKEGKFLGQSDFAHLCQAEIRCLDGKAQSQKNRFGGNMEITILD